MISTLFSRQRVENRRIGLFGGSFNPAHGGHFSVAATALARLQLDEIWWMVSPQNPLKPRDQTGDFGNRIEIARTIARHPRFVVSDIEKRLATHTTADTFKKLRPLFTAGHFVWIMGADSFAGLHLWNNWKVIPQTLPLAVFDRPGWTIKALSSPAATIYRQRQLDSADAPLLARHHPPAWIFLPMPQHFESSTRLRGKQLQSPS